MRKIAPPPSGAKTIRFSCAPASSPVLGRVRELARRSAGQVDALQLPCREEADGAPVRREEGSVCVVGAGESQRLEGIDAPDVELRSAAGAGCREGDLPSVEREIDGPRGNRSRGRKNRKFQCPRRGRTRGATAEREDSKHTRRGRERGRNRPGEIERVLAPSLTTRSFRACYSGAGLGCIFFEG